MSLAVHNESLVDGEATLFLFVRDPVASVARPLLELKGVQKAVLAAGERKTVTWRLPVKDLSFVGQNLDRILEPGRFEIHVGQSADAAGLLSCRHRIGELTVERPGARWRHPALRSTAEALGGALTSRDSSLFNAVAARLASRSRPPPAARPA